jgi:hypothetical protein
VAYSAFNCAVTAWSLADWVWGDLGDAQRAPFIDDAAFRKHCVSHSQDIEICESLANSAKHRSRRARQFKVHIATKTVAKVRKRRFGEPFGGPFSTWKWEAVILYSGTEHNSPSTYSSARTPHGRL